MKVIEPKISLEQEIDSNRIMEHIEKAGRVCYKSENKIEKDSAEKFITSILNRGHESVIEHISLTFKIICDRGVSHEIVRHRIASYSQESTRYCNYSDEKFGRELTFIRPCFWKEETDEYELWKKTMVQLENVYNELIEKGVKPQEARSILPNSLKTEIYVTMNLREWRHFLKLRTNPAAHPQMREVAVMILEELHTRLPVFFKDIYIDYNNKANNKVYLE